MKIHVTIYFLFLMPFTSIFGQTDNFRYNCELLGVSDIWHNVELPADIFGKAAPDMIDFRILGSNEKGETIEMPYIFREIEEKTSENKVDFELLNQTRGTGGYYFTFKISSKRALNHITLDFVQKNFDWEATIEGSQDQKEWFTITENERILAIKTPKAKYSYTTISFPTIQYEYLRVLVKGKEKPFLKSAYIYEEVVEEGKFYTYKHEAKIGENVNLKSTIIDLTFDDPVSISTVKINVNSDYDYYRNSTIKYLIDSTKIDSDWMYHYRVASVRTISSMEENEFSFSKITTQKLQITIQNLDNQPLDIDSIEVKGNVQEMVARFTGMGPYYLAYGNPLLKRPNYDISFFESKIPKKLKALTLGKEEIVLPGDKPGDNEKPIFNDEMWLWLLMIAIIIILGGFSLKMIRSEVKKR